MKKKIIGIIIVLMFIVFGGAFCLFPYGLERESVSISLHEEIKPYSYVKYCLFGDKKNIEVQSDVNSEQIGNYKIKYSYHNVDKTLKVKVQDKQAPDLKLKEFQTDTIEGVDVNTFVESCTDDSDYTLKLLTKNLGKEGKTTIKVKATDTYGNSVEKKTKLIRTKDTVAPTITQTTILECDEGASFDFENAISYQDDVDPNPTMSVDSSSVNLFKAGTYNVIYTVTDRSGNVAKETYSFIVNSVNEETGKIVYLTFDDGPSQNTKKVLDILDQYDAKATFFVTGRNSSASNYIQEAYSKGHTIGLHTYTHDYATVYASVDAYFDDLQKVSDYVYGLIGVRATAIRFPGGSSNTVSANYCSGIMSKLVTMVREKGYQYYDWNVSSSDASGNNIPVDTIVSSSTSSDAEKIMILCHDTDAKDTTVEALPKIIEYYKSKGYSFKAISSDSFAPHHGVNN